MTKLWKPLAVLVAVVLVANPTFASGTTHGILRVDDGAHLFSTDGVKKAKEAFEGTTFNATTHFTVVTFDRVPEAKRADYDLVKENRTRKQSFMHDWAVELAKAKRERGVLTLICMEAQSVRVVTD